MPTCRQIDDIVKMKRNKMKLKNKVIGTVFGVVASSFVFIAAPVSANAGGCSASDPCMTYAVVDGSGNVTNVIVCQPSVCGAGGELGGNIGGNKLVPQVAANPETHDTTGTTGNMTNSVENKVVTLSNDNVFTVKKDDVVVERIVVPETESVPGGTLTTSMNYTPETRTVTTVDSNGKEVYNDAEVSVINATQTTVTDTQNTTVSEQLVLEQKMTKEEVVTIVNNGTYVIFKSKMAMLTRLLNDWFLF